MFLDATKFCLHLDLLTTIFLISLASRVISPEGRMCHEIRCRYVLFDSPGQSDVLNFDSYMIKRLMGSSVDMSVCELELAITDHFSDWHLVNSLIKSLVCHMVWKHVLAKMSSFSVNASVSIQVLQPYSNIEMHVALKRWKFSLGFGDLSIDLILAYANLHIVFRRANV